MTSEKLMEEMFHIAYQHGLIHERAGQIQKEYSAPITTAVPLAFHAMKKEGLLQDEE
jgi:hypothetical protein